MCALFSLSALKAFSVLLTSLVSPCGRIESCRPQQKKKRGASHLAVVCRWSLFRRLTEQIRSPLGRNQTDRATDTIFQHIDFLLTVRAHSFGSLTSPPNVSNQNQLVSSSSSGSGRFRTIRICPGRERVKSRPSQGSRLDDVVQSRSVGCFFRFEPTSLITFSRLITKISSSVQRILI